MPNASDPVADFFARYPSGVTELAIAARKLIRSAIPEATETLDESGRVVGYAVGPGYSGLVCTIIPSRTGVKIGIVRGADLPDPHALMEGQGRKHRYVQINQRSDLRRAGITALIRNARQAAT